MEALTNIFLTVPDSSYLYAEKGLIEIGAQRKVLERPSG